MYLADLLPITSPEGRTKLGHSLLGRGPLFLMGIAAAWLYLLRGWEIALRLRQARAWKSGGADLLLVATFAALAFLLREVASMGYVRAEFAWKEWHLLEGGLWTIILLVALLCPLRTKILFCNPLWAYLGLVSYSLYLNHGPLSAHGLVAIRGVMSKPFAQSTGGNLLAFLVIVLMSVTLATLTYKLIEQPFLTRKTRLALWKT